MDIFDELCLEQKLRTELQEENDLLKIENKKQQAEIERLRATLQKLDNLSDVIGLASHRQIIGEVLNQQQPEPPQESPIGTLTGFQGSGLITGEMAGKAEAVEEPLKVRILRVLAEDGYKSYQEICDALGGAFPSAILQDLHVLQYVYGTPLYKAVPNGYNITAAGRDYLVGLDKQQAYIIPVRDDR